MDADVIDARAKIFKDHKGADANHMEEHIWILGEKLQFERERAPKTECPAAEAVIQVGVQYMIFLEVK